MALLHGDVMKLSPWDTEEVTKKKVGKNAWDVYVDGVLVGRIGGREGARWSHLPDGTLVSEDSPCSRSTVLGVLISEARERGILS